MSKIQDSPGLSLKIHDSPELSSKIHDSPELSPKYALFFKNTHFSTKISIFLRFSSIFIEAFKMAENLEKQVFTFFAFLPPYIGVSGSLASRKR